MNTLQIPEKTMSSREIAQLVNKSHSNIKISAERLAYKGTIALQGSKYTHNNNEYEEYLLCKRDSLVLVAQNSPEFTAAIVDRWQELEEKQLQPQLPANYIEALEALVVSEKDKKALSEELQIAAPKADYHDKVLATENGLTTTEVASELHISARRLNEILKDMGVQRKIGKRWVLCASQLGFGYTVESTHVDDGGVSRHSMKWTERGRKFIHELCGKTITPQLKAVK